MHKVSIIWGESPEQGQRPSTYRFSTLAALDAFLFGVDEASGWMSYHICKPNEVWDAERQEAVKQKTKKAKS